MKTTTVALGTHFDEFIQASVLGGRYTNASEVIRAGLRRLEEDEQKIAALRTAIEEGEKSGYLDDFDFEAHLEELNARRRNNG
jgi:antitoxin ParD1/3/4